MGREEVHIDGGNYIWGGCGGWSHLGSISAGGFRRSRLRRVRVSRMYALGRRRRRRGSTGEHGTREEGHITPEFVRGEGGGEKPHRVREVRSNHTE